MRDLSLENPIRAIREISHDLTCRRKVRLANGREASAIELQWEYLSRAAKYVERRDDPEPAALDILALEQAVVEVVAEAVVRAVRAATGLYGVPAASG